MTGARVRPARPDPEAMVPNPFFDEALAGLKAGGYRPRAWRALAARLSRQAAETARARPGLVREVRLAQGLGGLAALAVGVALWRADAVAPWLALTVPPLLWLALGEWVRVELGLVRHPITGAAGVAVGVANWMSLFRGWAAAPVALIAGFNPRPTWLWAGICLTAGLTDLFDGSVARAQRNETRLGRLLDPVLDAFFFTAAAAGLARWGLVPGWVAALVGARYFLPVLGGIGLMAVRGSSLPVRHTPWGQRSTFALGLALLAAWASNLLRLPLWLPPTLYAVAIATMALALLGIARRLPAARG